MTYRSIAELEAGLSNVLAAPPDAGVLELIVRRPGVGEREVIQEGMLDLEKGLVGDGWQNRSSSRTADGSPHPDMQVTIISSRAIQLVAGSKDRWVLAGDQLFVDLDLSVRNLSPGARLQIGEAIVEVTAQPHTGCKKFTGHFGVEAVRFVNSPFGRELNLRGINARVVQTGRIRTGDSIRKLPAPPCA